MLYVMEEVSIPKLVGSLLIIVFIYCFLYLIRSLLLWWKSDFKDLADPNRNSLSNYASFVLHLMSHEFNIDMILSHSFDYYKKKGYFCVNLIFIKITVLFHPDYIHELLSYSGHINRALFESVKKGPADDSLTFRNGKEWTERKQLLSPVFYKSNLCKFIPIINSLSKEFLNELLSVDENEWISIVSRSNFFIFNITMNTVLNGINVKNMNETFNSVQNFANILGKNFMENIINITFWINKIFYLTKRGKEFRNFTNSCREFIKNTFVDRIEKKCESSDENQFITLNDILLSAFNNKEITVESFIDEIISFIVAGIHISSSTLSLCLYELGKNPSIQNRVQRELNTILKDKKDDEINSEDLEKLTYLECVIKETLRKYPLIPFTTRKSCRDQWFGNEKFPKNSTFIISIYHLHTNSEIYPHPEVFDPDRFLPENSKQRPPCSFIPFSYGVRMCIGYNLNKLTMKICLATILRNVNIESLERDIELSLQAFQLIPKDTILIKLKRRENST